ncbi:MAG: hypothetical protein FVQ83_03940 [Chloroflexi bacterium]|nr:hypothetical protein [Chloroflexota bacterium]
MNQNRRGSLTVGVLLILLGSWFLAVKLIPGLEDWAEAFAEWPAWIIAFGLLFLVAGIVGGVPDLAVPAAIISGIGGILLYQARSGEWDTWAYAWALIPGFVGVGVLVANLLKGKFKIAIREGGGAIVTSLVLFTIFAGLLYQYVEGPEILEEITVYWPVALILLGVWALIRPFLKSRQKPEL